MTGSTWLQTATLLVSIRNAVHEAITRVLPKPGTDTTGLMAEKEAEGAGAVLMAFVFMAENSVSCKAFVVVGNDCAQRPYRPYLRRISV